MLVTAATPPRTTRQFGRYLLVGAWNTLFGYGCYALLTAILQPRFRYGYIVANLLANLISITVAFLGYKWFVFKTKGHYLREWLRCIVVYSGGIALSTALLPVVVTLIHRSASITTGAPYLAGAIVIGITVLFSFVGHKNFSFRTKSDGIQND